MREHPNVALHKKAHQASSAGDMDMMTELIPEDTVWHSPGKSPIAGDFHGRDAVFAKFFGKMDELSCGTARFVDHQVYFGADKRSVALYRWGAIRGGRSLVFRVCEVIRWKNGQIAEEWAYYNDQYKWDEFWS